MAKKRIITNPNLLVEELDGKLTLKVKDGGTNRNVASANNGGGIETAVFIVYNTATVICNKSFNEFKNCIMSNTPINAYLVYDEGSEQKEIDISSYYIYSTKGIEHITFRFNNGYVEIQYDVDGTISYIVEEDDDNNAKGNDNEGK